MFGGRAVSNGVGCSVVPSRGGGGRVFGEKSPSPRLWGCWRGGEDPVAHRADDPPHPPPGVGRPPIPVDPARQHGRRRPHQPAVHVHHLGQRLLGHAPTPVAAVEAGLGQAAPEGRCHQGPGAGPHLLVDHRTWLEVHGDPHVGRPPAEVDVFGSAQLLVEAGQCLEHLAPHPDVAAAGVPEMVVADLGVVPGLVAGPLVLLGRVHGDDVGEPGDQGVVFKRRHQVLHPFGGHLVVAVADHQHLTRRGPQPDVAGMGDPSAPGCVDDGEGRQAVAPPLDDRHCVVGAPVVRHDELPRARVGLGGEGGQLALDAGRFVAHRQDHAGQGQAVVIAQAHRRPG